MSRLISVVMVLIIFSPALASASSYEILKEKGDTLAQRDRATGWSYAISGGVALGVSIPAYYLSNDLFAQVVYSVGQTLGVAAVGYGSYLILMDNDYRRFRRVLDSVPGLAVAERNELAQGFLELNAERARNTRKIRVISHGLTAALNFMNAFTTSKDQLKNALLFIGGVNTLAALSFGFSKSEEENLLVAPGAIAVSFRF